MMNDVIDIMSVWGVCLLVSWGIFHRYHYVRPMPRTGWRTRRTLLFVIAFFLLWSVTVSAQSAQSTPLRSPYLHTTETVINTVPWISSVRAAIVMDADTEDLLWEQHPDLPFAIASLTKVMSALVVMQSGLPLDRPVRILASDVHRASTTHIRAKDSVTVETLLFLMLVGSDNAAARALAREAAGTSIAFVQRMNVTAASLRLVQSHFVDPAGLLSGNVMSGRDVGRLLIAAEAHSQSVLRRVFNTQQFSTKIGNRTVVISNTNRYVDDGMLASKTGFTSSAKYCLSILFKTPTQKRYVVVVLGATTSHERFNIATMFRAILSPQFTNRRPLLAKPVHEHLLSVP